jgi:photosystem II stability/assembly factor-like uncharacterized protein
MKTTLTTAQKLLNSDIMIQDKINLIFLIAFLIPVGSFGQSNTFSSGKNFYEIVEEHYKKKDLDQDSLNFSSHHEYEDVFQRWEWFWSSRVNAKGEFSDYGKNLLELSRKKSVKNDLIERKKNLHNQSLGQESIQLLNLNASLAAQEWTAIGPTSFPILRPCGYSSNNGLCQVTSIWANSTNLYVGLQGGGLWKKNGTSWENKTDHTLAFSVIDIEIDNNGKIYLATGFDGQGGSVKENDVYGMGVIYSTDDGATWVTDRMTNLPDEDLYIEKILIHPVNQSIVYALARTKLFKSVNGGYTWTDTQIPAPTYEDWFVNMVFKESDPNTIFVCSSGRKLENFAAVKGSIFKTNNGGFSWSTINYADNLKYNSLTEKPQWMDIATTPDDPNAIYVVYQDVLSNNSTLEKSDDEGLTWTTLVDRFSSGSYHDDFNTASYMMHNMAISPSNADNIFIGSVNQVKYNPLNSDFDTIASYLHMDLRDYFFVNNGGNMTIYQGNDAGIYSSTDNGATWTDLTDGIQGSLFYNIAISEQNPDLVLGGLGDCGTVFYDGTNYYHECIGGDGGTSIINEFNTLNRLAMGNSLYFRTSNGGASWPYSLQRTRGYAKPIIQHPTQDKIFIAVTTDTKNWWHRVRYSTDEGVTWSDYSPKWGNDRIWAMAISKSDPDYFYVAKQRIEDDPAGGYIHTSTVVRTTDDGTTWNDISSNLGSITLEAKISDIELNPDDENELWISFTGVSDGEKVYHTNNGGTTWSNISHNLDNLPVNKIEYDEENKTLFIANDLGIYFKSINDNMWSRMGAFPYAITTGLELNHTSGRLLASTWGRGLWETTIPGHCFEDDWLQISTTETWSTDEELCDNIIVVYGGELNIEAEIIMPFKSEIIVDYNGHLIIDSGVLKNANIDVRQGGHLTIRNGGSIELCESDNLEIAEGAYYDCSEGEIIINEL